MLYKIGEFSKIVNIPVKTLRYYDDINLFKPVEIDLYTQYRYYSVNQLDDLVIIKELQELGFSLNEIKENWNKFTDEILLIKREEILKEILKKNENIKKLDSMRCTLSNGKFSKHNNRNINNVKVKTLF